MKQADSRELEGRVSAGRVRRGRRHDVDWHPEAMDDVVALLDHRLHLRLFDGELLGPRPARRPQARLEGATAE